MGSINGIKTNIQNMFVINEHGTERQTVGKNTKQEESKTVFAGNLYMGQDSIQAKKQRAQKEAMKMISDAFQSDLKTDEQQKNRLNHIEELNKENAESKNQLKDIQHMQDNLMDEYGVAADSEEQKDLELIRKVKNAKDPFAMDKLTAEEKERYAQIQEKGLTQYQEDALALDEDVKEITSDIEKNQNTIEMEKSEYQQTKMQRLKENPMVGAKKQAEEYLEAARKEIIGDLYNEVKEHIDEKAEEAQKAQQEKQERNQEEEEKKAAQEAKQLEQKIRLQQAKENAQGNTAEMQSRHQTKLQEQVYDADLKDVHQSVDKSAEVSQEMKDLLDKMKLLQEDLKGAAVDNTL